MYHCRGPHHHSCRYSFALPPSCSCALPMAPRTRRSQAVSHPPLVHTQRLSAENLPQFSLATHGNTNIQSQSVGQNVTNSMQPNVSLNSELDRLFGETYHSPQYAERKRAMSLSKSATNLPGPAANLGAIKRARDMGKWCDD